ncbi:hypothetical protein D3C72_1075400 [compost metagenome]
MGIVLIVFLDSRRHNRDQHDTVQQSEYTAIECDQQRRYAVCRIGNSTMISLKGIEQAYLFKADHHTQCQEQSEKYIDHGSLKTQSQFKTKYCSKHKLSL